MTLEVGSERAEGRPLHVLASQILSEMAYLVDHGRATETLALYTTDPKFITPLGEVGREGLEAFLRGRVQASYQTRHAVATVRVNSASEDQFEASATVFVQRIEQSKTGLQVADWTIVCRRQGEEWKVGEFVVTPFQSEGVQQ